MALISKFISETKLNFSFSNLYRVEITKSRINNRVNEIEQPRRDLISLCNSAQIPGETIATTEKALDFKSRGKGRVYDDINLTFYCTETMKELKFFHDWMTEIVDPKTNRVGFHKKYVATIDVHQLGKNAKERFNTEGVIGSIADTNDIENETVSTTRIIEAYPKRIEPIALAYSATGTINTLNVSFAYTSHTHIFSKEQ